MQIIAYTIYLVRTGAQFVYIHFPNANNIGSRKQYRFMGYIRFSGGHNMDSRRDIASRLSELVLDIRRSGIMPGINKFHGVYVLLMEAERALIKYTHVVKVHDGYEYAWRITWT